MRFLQHLCVQQGFVVGTLYKAAASRASGSYGLRKHSECAELEDEASWEYKEVRPWTDACCTSTNARCSL